MSKKLKRQVGGIFSKGSFKAVCKELHQKATDLGLLDDKNTLKAMLETVSRNLPVETNGKRYRPSFLGSTSDVGRTQDHYICGNEPRRP